MEGIIQLSIMSCDNITRVVLHVLDLVYFDQDDHSILISVVQAADFNSNTPIVIKMNDLELVVLLHVWTCGERFVGPFIPDRTHQLDTCVEECEQLIRFVEDVDIRKATRLSQSECCANENKITTIIVGKRAVLHFALQSTGYIAHAPTECCHTNSSGVAVNLEKGATW